jgi:outer membrane receptor protein involved in Fe transport
VVFQPNWAHGLSVSLDYYHLTLNDAITTLAAQALVDDCYLLHQTSLCSGITRDPNTGLISQVFAQEFNAQQITTDGADFEAAYRFPLDALFSNAPGQFRLRAIGTYIAHLTTTVNGVTSDTAGQPTSSGNGGVPHWQGNVTATYDVSKYSVVTEVRYVGGGVFNSTYTEGVNINNNEISGRTYVSLLGSYSPVDNLQFYARISNLFNVFPPIVPLAVQAPHAANSPFYDVEGRAFQLGVRFHY